MSCHIIFESIIQVNVLGHVKSSTHSHEFATQVESNVFAFISKKSIHHDQFSHSASFWSQNLKTVLLFHCEFTSINGVFCDLVELIL
jgi:hypothetical protein